MGLSPLPPLEDNNPIGYPSLFPTPAESTQAMEQWASQQAQPAVPAATVPGQGGAGSVSTGTTLPGQETGILDSAKSILGKAAGSVFGSLFAVDTQAVTILIGLILIAGGIFLFKPVQNVVVKTAKEAAKASAVTA